MVVTPTSVARALARRDVAVSPTTDGLRRLPDQEVPLTRAIPPHRRRAGAYAFDPLCVVDAAEATPGRAAADDTVLYDEIGHKRRALFRPR